ncbi:MAG: 16S rRNA (guanine(527)-N(7))-methyltransferase RsmG [bacterium]
MRSSRGPSGGYSSDNRKRDGQSPARSKRGDGKPKAYHSDSPRDSRRSRSERPGPQGTSHPPREETSVRKPPHRTRKRLSLTTEINLAIPAWLAKPGRVTDITSTTIQDIFTHLGLPAEDDKLGRLLDHLLLVRELNEEINLVSRSSVSSVLMQSLWESLVPIRDLSWCIGNQVLDLGTGGGFPGVPLAIMLPDVHFTLIDSRRAKTLALRNVIEELKLNNVEVVHDRAETYSLHIGQTFDTVLVRAVGMLKEVASWAASLLRDGGTMLAWKGPEGAKEFRELPKGEWTLTGNIPVLPHRSVMILRYRSAT